MRVWIHYALEKLAASNELLHRQVGELQQQLTSERAGKITVGLLSALVGFIGGAVVGSGTGTRGEGETG